MDPRVSGCQSGQITQKRCSPVWLSQQSEKAGGTGDEGLLFVLEFLGSLCHPPLVQVQSPTREEDHATPGLYNLPVTEQLEPKASEQSATPGADRTQRLRFHHF